MITQSFRPDPKALLNPCADPIFKILFTDESDESHLALTEFLTAMIGKTVTDVVLQPNELSGEAISDKQTEFDINCKIDGKVVNIEMQGLNSGSHYGKRAEYHVAHLLNHYMPKGMDWTDAPQVFRISVLNFIFDPGEEDCISHYVLRNKNGRKICGLLNVIFMELPKLKNISDDVSVLTDRQMWGKFFLYASIPEKRMVIENLAAHNTGVNMAFTVLKNVSQDELNWYHETRYWMHVSDMASMKRNALETGLAEGLAKGLEEGRAEGILQGAREKYIENARNLLREGDSPEKIARCTGLSLEEVLNLK